MTDHVAARELSLYATNHGDLYRQRTQPVIANLRRKIAKGAYDPELAPFAWQHVADDAARLYCREFGCNLQDTFPRTVRQAAALEIMAHYAEAVNEGSAAP